ncbi:hypothetical protein ANO11243_011840 [Dothideomycetidae sp. 11243]|nr:hypothetical protein ANO11243_011840 [fungal sp. No.11243]
MPQNQIVVINKNLDLPVTVWAHTSNTPVEIQKRPKASTLGREIQIGLNTFNISALPAAPVYQYDVLMGNGDEKKPVIRKLWASKTLQTALPKANRWIYDGNKIAYCTERLERELRLSVDLDAEEGRQPKPGKTHNNTFRVVVKATTTNAVIRFDHLHAYLAGRADFGTSCLEAVNFLDHLLRQHPSQRLTAIKRNFFQLGGNRFPLGSGAEALKGTYASVRIGHSLTGEHNLTVNVDVANGTFWTAGPLANAVVAVLGLRSEAEIPSRARGEMAARNLKRLRRLHVQAKHRPGQIDEYCIDRILEKTASQHKIPAEGGKPETTVAQYFLSKYNVRVKPDWPLVQMTKKGTVVPLELLFIKENQRVNQKLDERQTSNMIKFAVTVPQVRWGDIQNGLRALNWKGDPYLGAYGLKINEQPVNAKGRLLQNPKVTFANGDFDPRTSGRWRLDGKKFLAPNKSPLKSWGVCIINDSRNVDVATVQRFMTEFVKIYAGHGGRIETRQPLIVQPSNRNPAAAVEEVYNATGNKFQMKPQILIFILANKDATTYGRIKKSCECRFGVMSQCMQAQHVQKAQGQYISNVLMKFNAKLGGITARACGANSKGAVGIFKEPTMIVAADVTHPPPASQGALADDQRYSVAAIVNSQDRLATRYTARVESNGFRMEMIMPQNWEKLWKPQLQSWMTNAGGGRLPSTIIYFRDGVSEGQFAAVIRQEVADMKEVVRKISASPPVKFVVIIASKRHHVRFFPKSGDASTGDKNGNALPGTLIETAVTHPYENDFFLCSHVALKGTARPVHYHVLLNEANLPNEMLQTMIYEHSYQFMRSTTPVSLYPAVYYADICALRGRYHDRAFGSVEGQAVAPRGRDGGAQPGSREQSQTRQSGSSSDAPSQIPELMELEPRSGISEGMWYI